jgi:K+/H+ antiporter YhaU regulatory subunit KhtT
VAEEVEGSLELLVRLLRTLETPRNVIDARVKEAREATHTSERKPTVPRPTFGELSMLSGLKVEPVRVEAGAASIGRSVIDLDLRRSSGALVVAVAREGLLLQGWSPSEPFRQGDVVFLAGDGAALREATQLLSAAERAVKA